MVFFTGRKDSIVINPHNARRAAAQRERNLQGLPKNQSYEENSRRLDENLIGNPVSNRQTFIINIFLVQLL